ncbi:MAG: hypothetical protein JOZ57_00295 [Abitibacteriaceae bacterium]|nr:hypothetical protein [Abditibacteriaceae bacterium]
METSEIRQEMIAVAEQMLAGKIGILIGSRQLAVLGSHTELYHTEIFRVFIGIDSQTDDLPLGPSRAYWNEAVLKAKDQEIAAYEASVKEAALKACLQLINSYKIQNAECLTTAEPGAAQDGFR